MSLTAAAGRPGFVRKVYLCRTDRGDTIRTRDAGHRV